MTPAFILFGASSHRTIPLSKTRLFLSEAANGELIWRTSRFLACLASVEVRGNAVWLIRSAQPASITINGVKTVCPVLLKDMDIMQIARHALAYVECAEDLNGSAHYGLLRRLKEMSAPSAAHMQ